MSEKKRRTKSRGNGTGCAYKRGGSWVAQVIVDWRITAEDKPLVPVKVTKGGFKTRDKALQYCPILKAEYNGPSAAEMTLQQIYDAWEPWYSPRVDPSTMAGYRAAYNYFGKLHDKNIAQISADDLQQCMDDCPKGKRTHQNMKVVAGLIWKYARDKHIVSQVESENLYTGKGKSQKREALTDIEVEKIRQAIGKHRYAEYIFCLCYLGYRPGEMLELRKDQLIEHNGTLFLIEGKKTEAGRNRAVPVHEKIENIIRSRLFVPGTDLIFPQYVFDRRKDTKGQLLEMKQMTDDYFRNMIFKPMMEVLGIEGHKVPYAARHTFSNKLKKVDGDDIDKAALMGHSNYTFTQTNYQDTNLDELAALMKAVK